MEIKVPERYYIVAEKGGKVWSNILSPSKEAAIFEFVSHRFLHARNLDSKTCNEFFKKISDFYEVKEYIVRESSDV